MKSDDLRAGRGLLADATVARDPTPGRGVRLDERGYVDPKILGSGTPSASTVLYGNRAWGALPTPVTYRKTTAKTVNTTVAATDLLNGEITIAAGVMGTTGLLRLTAWGDWLNNSGGAVVLPRFQLVFGGTTFLDFAGTGLAAVNSSASRYGWRLQFEIQNLGAANSQQASVHGWVMENTRAAGATGAAFTTGYGAQQQQNTATMSVINGGNTGLAVDTSASKALVLNVINASASASYETKLLGALVEII